MAAESRGATAARERAQRRLRAQKAGKPPKAEDRGPREARRRAKWQAVKAAIGDHPKPQVALTNELLLHSKRVAKLARIGALAEADGRSKLVSRAEAALEKERARHAARVEALSEALALAPTAPGSAGAADPNTNAATAAAPTPPAGTAPKPTPEQAPQTGADP